MILLPAPNDNTAMAVRRLEAGEVVAAEEAKFVLPHTVLEGHRIAVRRVERGGMLLSWGLPFGKALRAIEPGEYICNARILAVLRERRVGFKMPSAPNFENYRLQYTLDEAQFRPGEQIPLSAEPRYFAGYPRGNGRGAGTRNFLVVLATSSRANSVARAVAAKFPKGEVVAVTHTEGGGTARPNNYDLVVRTLNGFLRNPNVGAFVAIDEGTEPVNNACLQASEPRGLFVSMGRDFEGAVTRGIEAVKTLLPQVLACQRERVSVAHLKIGLQCGGSDAFSGVSGNPLIGWISREVVRHGGAANLAETDELIGAESYVLSNVRDLATAQGFLDTVATFQERAAWHGHSAEGNPSGGNLWRGLYNITVKSIGAALKKAPDVRLDEVIGYGEPMERPGFYFMDSPGNDLESIAGQVASGCNLILFATGNGSITNFPFVPTLKVMTTTGRFEMLRQEMDINAGRYIDGESMDELGREAFELTLRVASGELSAGERAGHAQAQLWREWRQTGPGGKLELAPVSGKQLAIVGETMDLGGVTFRAFKTESGWATQRWNLIVPTSLCSGQVAGMIAAAATRTLGRLCVTLPHTEGCGNSNGESERLMLRTLAGYAVHPLAARVMMLEHGCEKTHNDAFRAALGEGATDRVGWASIQLNGGIEAVTRQTVEWFAAGGGNLERVEAPVSALRVGFVSAAGPLPEWLHLLARSLAAAGALVVMPEQELGEPSIEYGQPAPGHGLHSMRAATDHLVEILTGLGATGVEVILAWTPNGPVVGHPLVPVLQVGPAGIDLSVKGEAAREVLALLIRAASGEIEPKFAARDHADFQITRGLEGVSL